MTEPTTRARVFRVALLLTVVFDVLALVVLLRTTPTGFAVFMFLGQPLMIVAVILLLGAVLADLRAKQLL
jgi:hypothetical protein